MRIPFTRKQPKTVLIEVTPAEAALHSDLGAALTAEATVTASAVTPPAAFTANARLGSLLGTLEDVNRVNAQEPVEWDTTSFTQATPVKQYPGAVQGRRRGPDGKFLPREQM